MVLLQSQPLKLLSPAKDFSLRSVIDDQIHSLASFAESKALLVAFICNHCPYVRAIEDRLIALKKSFSLKDFAMVGICANDFEEYPDDHPQKLKERAIEKNYGFPYLVDNAQTVAKAYGAVCTPDLFLFDQKRQLFYHGRLDDNWREPAKVKNQDLKQAIEAILQGSLPPEHQEPSMGCSIKWRE